MTAVSFNTSGFLETDMSSLLALKKEEYGVSRQPDFEGQRALKAFYHHRPSAPANINFFAFAPHDEFLQSSQSVLGDLNEEECMSLNTSLSTEDKRVSTSSKTNHQTEGKAIKTHHKVATSWISRKKDEMHKRRSPCNLVRPISFDTPDQGPRKMFRSVDWATIVPGVTRRFQDDSSSANKTKLPSSNCSNCNTLQTHEQNSSATSPVCTNGEEEVEERTHSILSDQLHFEQLDSELLETTDDEDNIFHAPYYLDCVGPIGHDHQRSPFKESEGIVELVSTQTTGLIASSVGLLKRDSKHTEHQHKKNKNGANMWSFVRKLATKLCKSPLVKDEQ